MSLELETVSYYQRHVIVEPVKYMNFIAETRNGEDRYKRKYCVEASPLGLGLARVEVSGTGCTIVLCNLAPVEPSSITVTTILS